MTEDEYNKYVTYEGKLLKSTTRAAGWDIVMPFKYVLGPGETKKLNTGVRFSKGIPAPAFLILRSSLQDSGLIQPSVGLIDPDYTDFIFFTVKNGSDTTITIQQNKRVAQLVFFKPIDILPLKPLRELR